MQPAVARCGGEMHEPDRLARHRAAWAGDAGDRHREIDRRVRERALGHGLRGLAAHRADASPSVSGGTPSIASFASLL